MAGTDFRQVDSWRTGSGSVRARNGWHREMAGTAKWRAPRNGEMGTHRSKWLAPLEIARNGWHRAKWAPREMAGTAKWRLAPLEMGTARNGPRQHRG